MAKTESSHSCTFHRETVITSIFNIGSSPAGLLCCATSLISVAILIFLVSTSIFRIESSSTPESSRSGGPAFDVICCATLLICNASKRKCLPLERRVDSVLALLWGLLEFTDLSIECIVVEVAPGVPIDIGRSCLSLQYRSMAASHFEELPPFAPKLEWDFLFFMLIDKAPDACVLVQLQFILHGELRQLARRRCSPIGTIDCRSQ